MGFLALEENEEEAWDGVVTLDTRVEDKYKAGVLGEAISSRPFPCLVPAGLCPLQEGGSSEGWAQESQSHLGLFWCCP